MTLNACSTLMKLHFFLIQKAVRFWPEKVIKRFINKFDKVDSIDSYHIKINNLVESDKENNSEHLNNLEYDTKDMGKTKEENVTQDKDIEKATWIARICGLCDCVIAENDFKNRCMTCKNWSCFHCCGGDENFDYICQKCFNDGPEFDIF